MVVNRSEKSIGLIALQNKLNEKSAKKQNEASKAVGIVINFLKSEESESPELQIIDCLNLMLDNNSIITKEEWPIFLNSLSDKFNAVINKIDQI